MGCHSLVLLLTPLLFATVVTIVIDDDDDFLIRQGIPESEDHLFKAKFGKTYATQEEHDHRFDIFKADLCRAKLHKKLDLSAVHDVTKFFDLTPAEFHQQILGVKSLCLLANAKQALKLRK